MADATSKRSVKRGEAKQAARVKKKETARKENKVKNRERVRTGKAQKADPGSVILPSIWERMAEDRLYYVLREMGDSTKKIDAFQKKRVLWSIAIMLLGIPAGLFIYNYLYIAGPVAGFALYKMKAKSVYDYHRGWKFQRQLNFSKFTRLVIPYLKASGGSAALYTIFNKILKRMDDPDDRRSLYRLMGEMGDNPADIQPFLDYAERSSGTDMSHLFMSTIFDFQQSTFDTQVIDELGQMAGDDMMNSIDEIIKMKLRRFSMFPTKVVMCSFILVVGLGAGLMLDSFKNLNMGGVAINPAAQVEDAGGATADTLEAGAAAMGNTDDSKAPAEETDEESWKTAVDAIANDAALDNDKKWQGMSRLAAAYEPADAEIEAFEAAIQQEYMTSMYTADLDNHSYTLRNGFQSQVIKQHYESDPKKPMYVVALAFWTNTYFTYVEGKTDDVTANEKKANLRLVGLQGVCSVKGDSESKTYHIIGEPQYDAAASNKKFCTVREAVNEGYTPGNKSGS